MRRIAIIILLAWVILQGCAGTEVVKTSLECRHEAILASLVLQDIRNTETKIWVGESGGGNYHAQTQALIDGKWLWCELAGKEVVCREDSHNFKPTMILTMREYIDILDEVTEYHRLACNNPGCPLC
jgi:hypothetical protein